LWSHRRSLKLPPAGAENGGHRLGQDGDAAGRRGGANETCAGRIRVVVDPERVAAGRLADGPGQAVGVLERIGGDEAAAGVMRTQLLLAASCSQRRKLPLVAARLRLKPMVVLSPMLKLPLTGLTRVGVTLGRMVIVPLEAAEVTAAVPATSE